MNHTDTDTPVAKRSPADKARWLAERYFRMERDEKFGAKLEALFEKTSDGTTTDCPVRDPLNGETGGCSLIGPSGTGKSALLMRTLKSHTAFRIATPDGKGNALLVTVPPEATSKSLAEEVARQTGYGAIAARANAYQAWGIVRHRLRHLGIRLLVIDEAHHLLRPGPGRDISGALQSLKHLLQGEGSTAVILAGVDKLRQGLLQDPETARRFKPFEIMRITEGSQDAKRFARSLQVCARDLGIVLSEADFSERILFSENGDAGLAIRFAKQVLLRPINDGRDRVTFEDARRVFYDLHPGAEMTPFADGDWDMIRAGLIKAGWSN